MGREVSLDSRCRGSPALHRWSHGLFQISSPECSMQMNRTFFRIAYSRNGWYANQKSLQMALIFWVWYWLWSTVAMIILGHSVNSRDLLLKLFHFSVGRLLLPEKSPSYRGGKPLGKRPGLQCLMNDRVNLDIVRNREKFGYREKSWEIVRIRSKLLIDLVLEGCQFYRPNPRYLSTLGFNWSVICLMHSIENKHLHFQLLLSS